MSKKFATSGSSRRRRREAVQLVERRPEHRREWIAGQHMNPDQAAQKWIAANKAKVNKWLVSDERREGAARAAPSASSCTGASAVADDVVVRVDVDRDGRPARPSVMCASYFALPSASVSTRTTVPPETFAFAAAVTFARASPVRGVSSLRWPPQGCCALGAAGAVSARSSLAVVVEPAARGAREPVAAAADADRHRRDHQCLWYLHAVLLSVGCSNRRERPKSLRTDVRLG